MGIKNSFFWWMFLWFSRKDESRMLRVIGSDSMKHPVGDIDFVKEGKEKVLLALNEMSLQGADSPLPDDFLRSIRVQNEGSAALADFLNMLQHHLAMLRFNAILEKNDFFMLGLGNKKWQNRFAMYNEKFSPESLRCFFVKVFPNAKISVHCFEPLRIENPSPAFFGKAILNETALLGKICTSLTLAMRVNIGGISLEQSIELKKKKKFLNVKFPFKVKLYFRTEILVYEICTLGKQKLSENFWLGNRNFEDFKWEIQV
jgi:predicted component of type VI protein secretion system